MSNLMPQSINGIKNKPQITAILCWCENDDDNCWYALAQIIINQRLNYWYNSKTVVVVHSNLSSATTIEKFTSHIYTTILIIWHTMII